MGCLLLEMRWNMESEYDLKGFRILKIYSDLLECKVVKKKKYAEYFGVHERSIQRDIKSLKDFFGEMKVKYGYINDIEYKRALGGYVLKYQGRRSLSKNEILAVCKILLESKAFIKEEMMPIIDTILDCCVNAAESQQVHSIIANEKFHYIGPKHNKPFINNLWDLGQAISEHNKIKINYNRVENSKEILSSVVINPLGLIFAEYYFYLISYIDGDKEIEKFPIAFRIDRIKNFKILDEKFFVAYSNHFEDGEYRKYIQFMQGGKLQTIEFKFWGKSVEAILDRLPTAQIVDEKDGVFTIKAETYGNGVLMWLLSQGDKVEVTKPEHFRNEVKEIVNNLYNIYNK